MQDCFALCLGRRSPCYVKYSKTATTEDDKTKTYRLHINKSLSGQSKFSALGLKNTSGLNIKFSWLKIIKRAKLAILNTGGAKVQQKTCV